MAIIAPPALGVHTPAPQPIETRSGAPIDHRIGLWRLPLRRRTETGRWDPSLEFVGEERLGPYVERRQRHRSRYGPTAPLMENAARPRRIVGYRREVMERRLPKGAGTPA